MAIADQIVGAEKGAAPDATNDKSSAMGDGQFLNGTWLDTIAKHRPDIKGSEAEILAMRADPVLSKEMTAAYAADNAGILSKAGAPVTPGTTYLAHFAGPQGAVGLLHADPSAPASAVLGPAVIKANPFLANMSAGDVAAWADRKMGGATPRAAAPMSMAGPPAAVPAPAAPMSLAPPPAQGLQYTAAPGGGGAPAAAAMPAPAAPPQQMFNILPQRRIIPLAPQRAPFSFGG